MTKTTEHDARGRGSMQEEMIMDQRLGLNPQRYQSLQNDPQYYSANTHLIANKWPGEHPQTIDRMRMVKGEKNII